MSTIPPQQFAAYPRNLTDDGDKHADRLQALVDGYYGLSKAFLLHILVYVVGVAGGAFLAGLYGQLAGLVVMWVVMYFVSLNYTKKVGFGAGWSGSGPIIASICICFFGLFGYIGVQSIAGGKIAKFGVRKSFLGGFRKRDAIARISELRAMSAAVAAPPVNLNLPISEPSADLPGAEGSS